MSSGLIRKNNTLVEYNEERNSITLTPAALPGGPLQRTDVNYDIARDLLDCLMGIFGKTELVYRYPEVR